MQFRVYLLMVSFCLVCGGHAGSFETRDYPVNVLQKSDFLGTVFHDIVHPKAPAQAWKQKLIQHYGLEFPGGSHLQLSEQEPLDFGRYLLQFQGTAADHERLRWGLMLDGLLPRKIQGLFRRVLFRPSELEEVQDPESAAKSDELKDADLIQLWREGKGQSVEVSGFTTVSGMKWQVQEDETERASATPKQNLEDAEATGRIWAFIPEARRDGTIDLKIEILNTNTEDAGNVLHLSTRLQSGQIRVLSRIQARNGDFSVTLITVEFIDLQGNPIVRPEPVRKRASP